MLQVHEVVERGVGEVGDAGGVEAAAGKDEHHVPRVDQGGEQDDAPLRLQPRPVRVQVLDIPDGAYELGPVQHLPGALRAQPFDETPRVRRAARVEAVAVEQAQRGEHLRALPRLRLPGDPAEGVPDGLRPAGPRPVRREGRMLGSLVFEVGGERRRARRVHQIAHVDLLVVRRRRDVQPVRERFCPPLAGDLERGRHAPPEPSGQVAEGVFRPGPVDVLRAAGGARCEVERGGAGPQRLPERIVPALEPEEHLVRLLLVLEGGRLVRLEEVEVEVAWRRRGRPFVRRAEEEIAEPRRPARAPLQLVLPDPVAGDVGGVGALKDAPERRVVPAVELSVVEGLGAALDQGVEVLRLLQVQVVLAVVAVGGDELAVDRPVDLAQHRLHLREQVVGRVAAEVFDARLVETEAVAQLLRRRAERRVHVVVGQAVDRQAVHDPDGHFLVGGTGERLPDARLQHLAAVDHLPDLRRRADRGVPAQRVPVVVVRDQAGAVGGQLLVEPARHGARERLQHFALLDRRDALERVDVVGMDGEEPDELVQPLLHAAVAPGERREVVPDLRLLPGRLAEQPLGDDVLDVGAGDRYLLEAVLHPPHAVRHVGEAVAVEDRLLHAGDETEAEVLADFADLAQEVQVEDQLLIPAALEVVEQLVDHQQQAAVGMPRVERGHHLLERLLVVRDRVPRRETVVDAPAGQRLLELRADERPQVHRGGAQLRPRHLEPPGDAPRGVRQSRMRHRVAERRPLSDGRDDGHQVRLAGSVVADDQHPLVVRRPVELQLRDQDGRELVGHRAAHDVGGDQPPRRRFLVRVAELHHRFDRIEPDQIAVLHPDFPEETRGPTGAPPSRSRHTTTRSRIGRRWCSG